MMLTNLLRNTFAAVLIAGAVLTSPAASADELLAIEMTNVASIDNVFTPVADIHQKLTDTQANIDSVTANIRTALGVADDAPLDTALADFRAQAGDALQFTMDGTKPNLSVSPEAPENIQAGVTALQGAFDTLGTVITELPTLKDDAMAAVEAAKGLDPKALMGEIKESGAKVGKTIKTLKNNGKSTTQTPDHITTTLESATGLMQTLTGPFQS
jgi:hypothetical protein